MKHTGKKKTTVLSQESPTKNGRTDWRMTARETDRRIIAKPDANLQLVKPGGDQTCTFVQCCIKQYIWSKGTGFCFSYAVIKFIGWCKYFIQQSTEKKCIPTQSQFTDKIGVVSAKGKIISVANVHKSIQTQSRFTDWNDYGSVL